MLPLYVDISETVAEFALTPQEAEFLGTRLVDDVVKEYMRRWNALVDSELHQTRGIYRSAMQVDRTSATSVEFVLSARAAGPLPMMLEEGATPFDEKIGFQRSDKAKIKKDGLGWYLTIPFRHATPGAIAESGIFNSVMPKDVYDMARNAGGQPLKLADLPISQQVKGSRKEINIPGMNVPEYMHKSAKYEGLVRVEARSSDQEKRGQYMTFRRVSDKSDPTSWFNGGITAKKLMDRALEESQIEYVAEMAIDEALKRIKGL